MNNYEQIKEMDIEQMAEFLRCGANTCCICKFYEDDECWEQDCNMGIKQWLQSESKSAQNRF